MSDPTDAQRLAKRGARLARQAAAAFAQAAEAAEPAAPAPKPTSRVVATHTVSPYQDPAVLARMIHDATQTHGTLDVLLVTDNHHGPDGAQEETGP